MFRADVRDVSEGCDNKGGIFWKIRVQGSQLAKDPKVIAFIERKKREKVEVDDEPAYRRNVYTPAVNTPEENDLLRHRPPVSMKISRLPEIGYEQRWLRNRNQERCCKGHAALYASEER